MNDQLLRLCAQQISFARTHLEKARRSSSRPQRNTSVQASILALNLGLVAYLRHVFKRYSLVAISELSTLSPGLGRSDQVTDARQTEVLNLWHEQQSWLRSFETLANSFFLPPPTSDEPAPGLIARSTDSSADSRERHWLLIGVEQLQALITSAQELLQTTVDQDQEY